MFRVQALSPYAGDLETSPYSPYDQRQDAEGNLKHAYAEQKQQGLVGLGIFGDALNHALLGADGDGL